MVLFISPANRKISVLLCVDIIIVMLAYLSTYYFIAPFIPEVYVFNIFVASAAYVFTLLAFGVYNYIIRFSSVREYLTCLFSSICCTMVISGLSVASVNYFLNLKYHLFAGIIIASSFVGYRVVLRQIAFIRSKYKLKDKKDLKNVLIIGAGEAGSLVIKDVLKSYSNIYHIVGVIDDDKKKTNLIINGVRILGTREIIPYVCKEKNVDLILFSIPTCDGDNKKQILDICHNTGKRVKVMPGINDLIIGKSIFKTLKDIDVCDLLPRNPIKLDDKSIKEYISEKVVLVTGGGGSIGSELCRQVARFKPSHLVIVDIYENNAYDIENELKAYFPDVKRSVVIASVRDKKRLEEIFSKYRPDIVFHAAAHKHVPLMEENAEEAVKNNVFGTLNTAECANAFGAEKFILISTDKAVNPTNVMGASKRICEMIIQAINKESKTDYVAVRFGNVLGSNGSVIPLFKKQIENGGPVTVTHREITRFFMTIPEAAQLVLQAGTFAEGGEIFVLDMGEPVKIYDLAVNMIKLSGLEPEKDINIEISGLRPGEKLYEELLMSEEGLTNTSNNKIYIAKPMEIDYNELKGKLNFLLDIIKEMDYDDIRLKKEISNIVPTYQMFTKK